MTESRVSSSERSGRKKFAAVGAAAAAVALTASACAGGPSTLPKPPKVTTGSTFDVAAAASRLPDRLPSAVQEQIPNSLSIVGMACNTDKNGVVETNSDGFCTSPDNKHNLVPFSGIDLGDGAVLTAGHANESATTLSCGDFYMSGVSDTELTPAATGTEFGVYNNLTNAYNAGDDVALVKLSDTLSDRPLLDHGVTVSDSTPYVGEVLYAETWQELTHDVTSTSQIPSPSNKSGAAYNTPSVYPNIVLGQNAGGLLILGGGFKSYSASGAKETAPGASGAGLYDKDGNLVAEMNGIPMNVNGSKLTGTKLTHVPANMELEAATIVTPALTDYLSGQAAGQNASPCTVIPE
ncbi:MAG TPA: hypothetical protein VIM53_02450 [Candidatus Saccharimonadales bacterium]